MKKLAGAITLFTLPLVTTLQAATHNSRQLAPHPKGSSGDSVVVMDKKVAPQRIISAGNGVTELIYALGAGNQVIAVDSTSH